MAMLRLLLACVVGWVTASPLLDQATPLTSEECGYASCTDADQGSMLNVHIVPHTHDDVGWLKTVDQYYYGSRNDIQKAGVQYILDSVIKGLWENPKRRFMYVETAFFWKWWMKQSDDTRHKVHTLVRQGRLQMVGGAWSMNDEAAAHYHSTIDQFTWGLSKLNATFGACGLPRVGWQIDPFGHSREFASLLAAMGYDGLFLGRIDYQDKDNRKKKKTMEMLWRGDDDLGEASDIFTGILYNTYSPPPGFCFDILCQDEPIIDDPSSPMYNVDAKVRAFLHYVDIQKQVYRSNNVILTMGGDFTYQEAGMYFKNLDKLIEYTNVKAAKEGLNIKLFYSTPNCYLKAIKDANPTLPTKQDDFFPYASDPTAFWTGYFTSRPTTKYFERQGNNYLQMAKQLQVLAGLEEHNSFVLNELKSAMGIFQHHDAITGTEKQHVARDYERILDNAIEDSLTIPRQAFNKFVQGDAVQTPPFYYNRCRLNESSCETSEQSEQFVVTVYNPLAWHVNDSIRIPVTENQYAVYAPNGDEITSQVVDIPQYVLDIPTRSSQATHEVVFIAHLKPTSYKNFFVKRVNRLVRRSTQDGEESNNMDVEVNENINVDEINDDLDNTDKINDETDVQNTKTSQINRQHNNDKKKDYYNTEMNDYWKKIREQPYVDIKNIEEQHVFGKSQDFAVKIPAEPVFSENLEGKLLEHANLNVLRDTANGNDPHLKEFEGYIREAKKLSESTKSQTPTHTHPEAAFTNLNQDEMRMLSDEPRIVERFAEEIVLENKHFKLAMADTIDEISLTNEKGVDIKFNLKYSFYPGCLGNNENPANRSSGAYIFRPNATKAVDTSARFSKGASGAVVKEIRVTTQSNVASTIRMYDHLDYIENDWVVGPIDISDNVGKEFVVKYATSLVNNGEFYTDSNGRQMLKRKLFQRPQWNVTLAEPVPGNYYPITNKIFIHDGNTRVSVLTDRSEGGSSLTEGEIEVMLHRRLLHDDSFGVGEALNEIVSGKGLVVRGTHRLYITKSDDKQTYILEKKRTIENDLKPQVFVSKADDLTLENWLKLKNCYSWINELPTGLHLLTLEPYNGNTLLLRLENYLELSDKEESTIQIDLTSIFTTIKVKSFRETTLAANRWMEDVKKWTWNTENEFKKNFNRAYGTTDDSAANNVVNIEDDGSKINIKAKQIRTFIVAYELN